MGEQKSQHEAEPTMADRALACLVDLFRFQGLKSEQWYMRVSVGGYARGWELLNGDSQDNNRPSSGESKKVRGQLRIWSWRSSALFIGEESSS